MTTRTTTAALLLAASTFALTAAPLAAQTATDDGAATATDPLAEGVTTGTDLAQEGAAATVDAETGAGTDVAQDDTQSEIDAETGAGTELAQEGAATVDAETGAGTDVAQDDTQSEIDAETGAGTDLAQEGTATENATGTDVAADDAATGAATGAATDGTALAQDESATGDTGAEVTTEEAIAAGDGAATDIEGTQDTQTAAGDVPSEPTEPMAAVLEKHAELGARPIEELSVEEARTQPTPADAVMALMQEQGIEMPAELAAIATRDVTYPGADGSEQQARVYTPEGEGPFPLILYFHGGGWVIADIDTYDASARALAAGANAVVVSAHYRQGPENPFPAAHDDANAAFVHFVETSGEINADTERLAVAGESAGGNLAFNVAAYARDNQLTPIDHMLLVYPVAGDDMETASYQTNAEARPLSRAGMMWFVEHAFEDPSQTSDPRIDIVGGTTSRICPRRRSSTPRSTHSRPRASRSARCSRRRSSRSAR
jgi:acetyl esterase/lipase